MRGLSLTRRRNENIVLHIAGKENQDDMVLGVIAVTHISSDRVRLRLACRPSISISRVDSHIDLESQEDSDE